MASKSPRGLLLTERFAEAYIRENIKSLKFLAFCEQIPQVTHGLASQRASNAEIFSRHDINVKENLSACSIRDHAVNTDHLEKNIKFSYFCS